MAFTQSLLAVVVLTLTVLVGILLNKNDNSRLEAGMSGMENRLDARMNGLETRFHTDMLMVIGKLTELGVRVARLEGTQK